MYTVVPVNVRAKIVKSLWQGHTLLVSTSLLSPIGVWSDLARFMTAKYLKLIGVLLLFFVNVIWNRTYNCVRNGAYFVLETIAVTKRNPVIT